MFIFYAAFNYCSIFLLDDAFVCLADNLIFRRIHSLFRVVGGQSRKMAKPIFGRGLAMRCERSEHGKSQLSKKISLRHSSSCFLFLSFIYHFQISLSLSATLCLFASKSHCASRLADNVLAAWRQAGVSVRLGREVNFPNPAKCHTRQHPRLRQTACWAKAFLYFHLCLKYCHSFPFYFNSVAIQFDF